MSFSLSSCLRVALGGTTLAAALAFNTGCNVKSLVDPSELAGRNYMADKKVLPVQILDSIDPTVEETSTEFIGASEPRAEDAQMVTEDYRLGPNDLIRITVSDLEGPGVQTLLDKRVSETGNISLPYVGQIRVAGSSESQLEDTIVKAYGPDGVNIIQRANVSVTLTEARGRTFSILGAVNRPGQYAILQSDFRILDALVLASDTSSPLNDSLYIIRKIDTGSTSTAPAAMPAKGAATPKAPVQDDLAPDKGATTPTAPRSDAKRAIDAALTPVQLALVAQAKPAAADDLAPDAPAAPKPVEPAKPATPDAVGTPPADTGAGAGNAADSRIINVGGQDVTANPNSTEAVSPAPAAGGAPGFEFADIAAQRDIRVIKIPLDLLRSGDLKYNIPVRANDRIIVQPLEIGEYYMGGHVARPGAYSLTGRRITLKQAIIAASGLDQLAIPQRTDIIRRINKNQEVFVRVDLAQIFEGQRPDIYLKHDDQIMVGTNMLAPFLSAARGAFRFTYGMGFLYDRNYAYEDNQNR